MDPLKLAETLRRERQFINGMLDNVRDTNEAIKASLDRLHIDSWVNYQLGSRLALGSAFVTNHSTVNWTDIVQHLKGTRLLPAKKIITLEEGSVSLFLDKVRQNGKLIAEILVYIHEKSLDSAGLIRDLIPTIYGQLLLPEDVVYCQGVINRLVEILVQNCPHPRVFLQGHESMFTLFFAEYAEYDRSTRSYLVSILKPTVVKVVAESSWYMETNIFKAVLGLPEEERNALEGQEDIDGDGLKKSVEESIRIAERKLKNICNTLFDSLLAHLPMLPKFLAHLLSSISRQICDKWGVEDKGPMMKTIMSAFIMDIIVVPALVNPERFGIVPSVCLEEKARFNLTQLATLLHAVPRVIEAQETRRRDPTKQSPLQDTPATQIVDSMDLSKLADCVIEVVSRGCPAATLPFSEESIPLIPGLQRCSVMATEEQVQRIVSLFVSIEERLPKSKDPSSLQQTISESLSCFNSQQLSSSVILTSPYSVENGSLDPSASGSSSAKTKAKGSPNPNSRSKTLGGAFRRNQRKRSDSCDALSPSTESTGAEKSSNAQPQLTKGKHKRFPSATQTLKMPRPSSPPNSAPAPRPAFTFPVLPSCSLCGVSHDIHMIPLPDRTDSSFEEFRIMSEKEFMKTMAKKQKDNIAKGSLSSSINITQSSSEKDSGRSLSPLDSSTSSFSTERKAELQQSSSSPIPIVRSQSLEALSKSGRGPSSSPGSVESGVVSPAQPFDLTTPPEQNTWTDADAIRRAKSLSVPRKPIPTNSVKMEPADSVIGARPSLYAIDSLGTLSVEDFQANTPTLSAFRESGLFASLQWKLRLALAKLPGNCLPLTPQVDTTGGGINLAEFPSSFDCNSRGNRDKKSIRDTLLWMLYKSTSHVEWFHGPSIVNATVGVLFGDVYRWMQVLPEEYVFSLLEAIAEEYGNRAHFVCYLVQLQQVLLDARTRISEITEHMECERLVLIDRCVEQTVSEFLDCRRIPLQKFSRTMKEMEAVDERCLYYQDLLDHLTSLVQKEASLNQWSDSELVLSTLEDRVLSLVQDELFYPNDGDLDKAKDDVFSHYLMQIGDRVTLNHESLLIPRMYHADAPWTLAQERLSAMNVIKTPKGKLQCVCDCCKVILSSLQQSRFGSPAGADEMFPILVYVIVKSNPPNLLSTIQFVNNFTGRNLSGEQAYWWTQFSTAVEFSKTLKG